MDTLGYGFAIYYIFLIFTSNNDYVFTFTIPMLILCMAYCNVRFSTTSSAGIIVLNLAHILYIALTKGISSVILF